MAVHYFSQVGYLDFLLKYQTQTILNLFQGSVCKSQHSFCSLMKAKKHSLEPNITRWYCFTYFLPDRLGVIFIQAYIEMKSILQVEG